MKEAAYKGMVRPVLEYGSSVWDPDTKELQDGNRVARFVTRNYVYETGGMTAIIGQLKWESLKKSLHQSSEKDVQGILPRKWSCPIRNRESR